MKKKLIIIAGIFIILFLFGIVFGSKYEKKTLEFRYDDGTECPNTDLENCNQECMRTYKKCKCLGFLGQTFSRPPQYNCFGIELCRNYEDIQCNPWDGLMRI